MNYSMREHGRVFWGTRRMKMYQSVVAVLCGFLMLALAHAQEGAASGSLEFISYVVKQNEGVELQLTFSGTPVTPASFTTENPARITLDLEGAKNALPWTMPLPIKGGGAAKSVSALEASGRTRVVITLDKLVPFTTRIENNNVFVLLSDKSAGDVGGGGAAVEPPKPAAPAPAVAEAPVTPAPGAEGAGAAELKDVQFFALPGDKVQVKFKFAQNVPTPNTFTIDNPARIVLDLPATSSKLPWTTKQIGVGAAQSVAAIEASGRTRVVLSLTSMRPFDTQAKGDELVLNLQGEHTGSQAAAQRAGGGLPFKVENIDFRRGDNGEGRIVVDLSDPGVLVDTRVIGDKIYVDFLNAGIGTDLVQRMDVIDFATPVQFIDSKPEGLKARLMVTVKDDFEHMAYQSEKTFTLDVKKFVADKVAGKKREEYVGEKLSLNFQDVEVRAVLQLIADFTGLNMVASDTVKGNLTLRLKNVPWDQALEIVLKTKGLAMRQEGNVILVGPGEEIAAREKMELEALKQVAELKPLQTDIIQVNYAKAEELAALVKGEKGATLLSERGNLSVDVRTNSILVTDTRDKLVEVRELINKLDIPIRQVMIESRIVIANSDFSRDIGARFGVTSVNEMGSNNDLVFTSGSYSATDTMAGSAMSNLAATSGANPYPISIPSGTSRLNVNMPLTASNAGRFAMAILRGDQLLDLELSALQAEGRGEVVSNPRVITSNGKEALIEQGTEIPYLQASSSGATNVVFKKAVLSLKVTPQITPDNRVLMDLNVTKDSVGEVFFDVPSIDTKEVLTQVLVDNGDTVVLGGVYEQEKSKEVDKVPLLGDIPVLGALFRQTRNRDDKTELLIFVTPKILKEGARLP